MMKECNCGSDPYDHMWDCPAMTDPKPVSSRKVYEGLGGWADGRLGQAYDLIGAAMSDQRPEWGSRAMLKDIMERIEASDIEIGDVK